MVSAERQVEQEFKAVLRETLGIERWGGDGRTGRGKGKNRKEGKQRCLSSSSLPTPFKSPKPSL